MINIQDRILKLFRIKSLSIYQLTIILFISASILSVIIISTGWVIAENIEAQKKISKLKENAIEKQKEKLKEEVQGLISYIKFAQKDTIQFSLEQIKDKTLLYFESLRFGNDGYVFVNTYNGNALLFNGKKLDVPKKMSELKYPKGINFYETEMKLAKNPEGGAFQYDFIKLNDSVSYPKMSYIMGFNQWGWILGAGDYLDNLDNEIGILENELKNNLYEEIVLIVSVFILILILLTLLSVIPAKFIQNQFNKFVQVINNQLTEDDFKQNLNQIRIRDLVLIGNKISESETLVKQFGKIIDSSNNDIYIINKDNLQFAHANNGAIQNGGYLLSELQKMNFLDVLVNMDREHFLELINPLINNQSEKIQFESFYQRKDKSIYAVDVQLSLSYLNKKEVYIAFIYDITNRKKTEADLINNKNYVQTILDASTDAIILHDAETMQIIDANKQIKKLFGYKISEVIGLSPKVLSADFEPYSIEKAEGWFVKSKTEGMQTVEWMSKHKDGYLFFSEINIVYIKIDNKFCFLVNVRNIDERKKVEEELRTYRIKLEDIVKVRTEQLEEKNKHLEQVNTVFVGRELKMIELKEEIEKLKQQLK